MAVWNGGHIRHEGAGRADIENFGGDGGKTGIEMLHGLDDQDLLLRRVNANVGKDMGAKGLGTMGDGHNVNVLRPM